MNFLKNKTLVAIVVILVAFGLVVAYIPFLSPQSLRVPEPDNQLSPSQTATLTTPLEIVEVVEETENSTSSDSSEEVFSPDSFLGLEEESDTLSELDSLLDDLN